MLHQKTKFMYHINSIGVCHGYVRCGWKLMLWLDVCLVQDFGIAWSHSYLSQSSYMEGAVDSNKLRKRELYQRVKMWDPERENKGGNKSRGKAGAERRGPPQRLGVPFCVSVQQPWEGPSTLRELFLRKDGAPACVLPRAHGMPAVLCSESQTLRQFAEKPGYENIQSASAASDNSFPFGEDFLAPR